MIGVSGLRDDDDGISPLAESVQLMDTDEGGPKSNRNTYKFVIFFFYFLQNKIWLITIADCPILDQSACEIKSLYSLILASATGR